MSSILMGRPVAKEIKDNIKVDIAELKKKKIVPTLGIIRMGERADDLAYENSITDNCEALGIGYKVFELEREDSMDKFIELLDTVNNDDNIHGILIFRPLPAQIDIDMVKNTINPDKDIDCMNPLNLQKVFTGDLGGFIPCTPKAVIEILKYYNYDLKGANVAVVNSSLVVGRPLSMMLLKEKATPTICHSKTKDLMKITSNSDIVVTAIGKAKFFGTDYFNDTNVVIDVGINNDEDGGICGDIDYDEVEKIVKAITPVPGGIGSVTTSILLSHVIKACKEFKGI